MICEKCGGEFDEVFGSYASGRFCSRKCSNSRIFSEESIKKKSEACKKRFNEKGAWGGYQCLSPEKRKQLANEHHAYYDKILMSEDFNSLSKERKRKRVIIEQDRKCSECGLSEWRGKRLPLEIEHKNGDHSDNTRENLMALCPNCHSLTLTWRGRNKSRGNWLSGPEIYELYKSGMNIRQILLQMKFAAKGANYAKVKRILSKFEF